MELGGEGHLSDINNIVEGHPKTETNPTWRDTIRRVVRQYKIFEPVPPQRSGIYRLQKESPVSARTQTFAEDPEIDHGIAQGMLSILGRIYGYEVYAAVQDQTTRRFQGRPLREFVSVGDCTHIFQGPNLGKIRQIDLMWFDEDDYGLYPVYAFEVEHTTRVKSGLDRLLKIPRRFSAEFFIVGPGDRERVFEQCVNQTPFRNFKERFHFRSYGQLEDLYNSALVHSDRRKEFGIVERRDYV